MTTPCCPFRLRRVGQPRNDGQKSVTSGNENVIIGIDPGLMTGVYLYGNGRGRNYNTGDHITAEEFPMQFGSSMNGILGWAMKLFEPGSVHIAIERYIITPKTAKLSQQTEALEVTGMAKGFAALA